MFSPMKAVVGVTDNRWAAYLRDRPMLTEANFWLPSASTRFRALRTGEPFLFKTHWPDNRMVGGGFFSGYDEFTVREAWQLFGEGNGVADEAALARAIATYRRQAADPQAVIGCVLLRDLFFTPEDRTVDAPRDFAKNIVRFKGYDLADGGSHVDFIFSELLANAEIRIGDELTGLPSTVAGPVFGRDQLVTHRVGQQAFKGLVLTSYDRRCAITGNHIAPTLQAAHIRPVSKEGPNAVSNGLLLRSDVHTLLDLGYLSLNPRHELQVSTRLRSEWGNGEEFYDRAGEPIRVPTRRADRPDREFVEWHHDTVFLR